MSEGTQGTLGGMDPPAPPAPPATPTDWRSGVSEEFRSNDHVQKHENLDDFVKDAVNAQGLIGRTGIRRPDENSTIEDWSNFYGELGRPKSSEAYELDKLEYPEGARQSEDYENTMRDALYDAGLSKAQAQRVWQASLEKIGATYAEMETAREAKLEEFTATLKRDWGEEAYDGQLQLAEYAFQEVFGERASGFGQMVDTDGIPLGAHPDIIKKFAEMGARMREDTLEGPKTPSSFAITREGAMQQIAQLQNDKDFTERLYSNDHPGHAEAVAERDRLYEIAYPEENVA